MAENKLHVGAHMDCKQIKKQTIPLNEKVFRRMSLLLEDVLNTYSQLGGGRIKFQKFNPFMLTPEKPNSARTIVPVTYNNTNIGDMCVIAFRHGDGTGDSKTYTVDSLTIPEYLICSEHQEKILPRKKEGVFCEGFFPLFTLLSENEYHKFAVSLELLTIDDTLALRTKCDSLRKIVIARYLGLEIREFYKTLRERSEVFPEIQYTCGYKNNKRFGDPHAIHNGGSEYVDGYIQVAGFLAVKDAQKHLIDEGLCSNWILPFE